MSLAFDGPYDIAKGGEQMPLYGNDAGTEK